MEVTTALNRLALSLLLVPDLEWSHDSVRVARRVDRIMINGNAMDLTRCISKTSNKDSSEDTYYFDVTLQDKKSMVLVTHEQRLSVPHHEQIITDRLSEEELYDFISLNEESKEHISTYWLGGNHYRDWVIRTAENIMSSDQKGEVLTKS